MRSRGTPGRPSRLLELTAIGANIWIWESPITDQAIARVARRVSELGFDLLELPVEEPGQWDPQRAAELLEELGLGASVCCVMPPGRDLAVDDGEVVAATAEYLKHCVEAATVGSAVVAGPMYAAVGRLWRLEEDERRRCCGASPTGSGPVAELAAERGVRLAIEPLNRYETSLINTVEQGLSCWMPRIIRPAACSSTQLPHEHRGEGPGGGRRAAAGGSPTCTLAEPTAGPRAPTRSIGPPSSRRLTRPATTARCASSRSPRRTR